MKKIKDLFLKDCIIAEGRKDRPFVHEKDPECPFCGYDQPMFILPNKYPVVSTLTALYGKHDVVVDTPHHLEHPKAISNENFQELMLMMHRRFMTLCEDTRLNFIQIFKNYGTLGGASISHSHWQIIATEKIPDGMQKQYEAYHQHEGCYLCDLLNDKTNSYKIDENDEWLILAASVPVCAYETWLVPKRHHKHFGELSEKELRSAGVLLKKLIAAYDQLEPHCAFNICMMSGGLHNTLDYHFHIKLMMRLGNFAGFELATHCNINMISPQTHIMRMKNILKE